MTPRLDAGPRTPRLDAMAKPAPTNLEKRQSLFRDMQKLRRNVDPPDMVKPGSKRQGWRVVSNVKRGW